LEVVSRDVGLTSKLSYNVVMHTAPGDFILCPMLCRALHWTDNNQNPQISLIQRQTLSHELYRKHNKTFL